MFLGIKKTKYYLKMSIKSKADWLRGFLESLEYSDTISKRQIQIIKEKLNLLLEEIELHEFDEDVEDWTEENENNQNNINLNRPISHNDSDDDLPF